MNESPPEVVWGIALSAKYEGQDVIATCHTWREASQIAILLNQFESRDSTDETGFSYRVVGPIPMVRPEHYLTYAKSILHTTYERDQGDGLRRSYQWVSEEEGWSFGAPEVIINRASDGSIVNASGPTEAIEALVEAEGIKLRPSKASRAL